jgi:hypothetical protein
MYNGGERRKEERLNCDWVIWFLNDFNQKPYHGMMHDLSSCGVSLICHADDKFPKQGQQVTTYFYIPSIESGDDPYKVVRTGKICRVTSMDKFLRRIQIQFSKPLPFTPNELKAVAMTLDNDEQ